MASGVLNRDRDGVGAAGVENPSLLIRSHSRNEVSPVMVRAQLPRASKVERIVRYVVPGRR